MFPCIYTNVRNDVRGYVVSSTRRPQSKTHSCENHKSKSQPLRSDKPQLCVSVFCLTVKSKSHRHVVHCQEIGREFISVKVSFRLTFAVHSDTRKDPEL
jgi:hypothetical protein